MFWWFWPFGQSQEKCPILSHVQQLPFLSPRITSCSATCSPSCLCIHILFSFHGAAALIESQLCTHQCFPFSYSSFCSWYFACLLWSTISVWGLFSHCPMHKVFVILAVRLQSFRKMKVHEMITHRSLRHSAIAINYRSHIWRNPQWFCHCNPSQD